MTHDEQLIDMAAQKRDPTGLTFIVTPGGAEYQYHYRVPISERLSVWFRNLPHWPTALAVWYLSRQLQRDKAFRDAWHAKIAMPIYDATRPPCSCVNGLEVGMPLHEWGCPRLESVIRGDLHGMSGTQANQIADKLMEHLFGA